VVSTSRLGRIATLVGLLGMSVGVVVAKSATGPGTSSRLALGGAVAQKSPTSSSTNPTSAAPRRPSPVVPSRRATAPSTTRDRRLIGAAESFPYGSIQVEVVLSGTRISDVVTLQAPQDGYSAQVAQMALPALRHEVLTAQSARIDTVSGASYDSEAYARSVQSALDQARA
jgi:uncharacterized protein with FMN-binding domain